MLSCWEKWWHTYCMCIRSSYIVCHTCRNRGVACAYEVVYLYEYIYKVLLCIDAYSTSWLSNTDPDIDRNRTKMPDMSFWCNSYVVIWLPITDQWSVISYTSRCSTRNLHLTYDHDHMIIWYMGWCTLTLYIVQLYNCSSFLGCQPGYRYGQHRNAGACCVLLDHKYMYMYMYHLSWLCQDMGGSWIGWCKV